MTQVNFIPALLPDGSLPPVARAEVEQLVADPYLIVGAGRPDIVGTLASDVATRVQNAPSGAVFRSTDGPQGAWEWQRRGTSWRVTSGWTGWVTFAPLPAFSGEVHILRTADRLHLSVQALGGGEGSTNRRVLENIPQGWRASRTGRPLMHVADTPGTSPEATTSTRRFQFESHTLVVFAALPIPAVYGDFSCPADPASWPTTLTV